jgi:uncharacterized protein (DUF488 family)
MIFTIGHSTLSEEAFLEVIKPVDIVLDIRSHPTSKWPQFRKENMEQWLPAAGKKYEWEPGLGGWDIRHAEDAALREQMLTHGVDLACYSKGKFPKQRIAKQRKADLFASKEQNDQLLGARPIWTNLGLFDYAYFETLPEFLAAAQKLIGRGKTENIGILCCEVLWWKCHRASVSDYLAYKGVETFHLQPKLTPHSKALSNRIFRYPREVVATWGSGQHCLCSHGTDTEHQGSGP